jgi:hypothetical protein
MAMGYAFGDIFRWPVPERCRTCLVVGGVFVGSGRAFWTLLAGRTAIVMAHRLSTVRRMDELVILDRGRIVERGSHKALFGRAGIYAALWAHQWGDCWSRRCRRRIDYFRDGNRIVPRR